LLPDIRQRLIRNDAPTKSKEVLQCAVYVRLNKVSGLDSYIPLSFLAYRRVQNTVPRSVAPWETERKALVKAEDKTDPSFGCNPEERSDEQYLRYGVINLDKPAGPSSHEVAAWVKRILKLQGVGHGGTLEA
jgi:hypothetical protein